MMAFVHHDVTVFRHDGIHFPPADQALNHGHVEDPFSLTPSVSDLPDLGRIQIEEDTDLRYPLIQEATTTRSLTVYPYKKLGPLRFGNTNRLLKNKAWNIALSKTGYINEAGRCLVMQAKIEVLPLVIVLLNSFGNLTPFGDSNRIRQWIESCIQS